MLRSYAFMPKEIDIAFYYDVWNEILKLKWYFYKFAGTNADEAMQRTLMHTLMHFQAEKGNLSAYIKKLAREITKENSKVIYVDFLEQTLSDEDDDPQPSVDTGRIVDFSIEVVNEMELSENRFDEVACLSLEFMDKFVKLCQALETHDTSTEYYPESFISQCLAINSKCPNFNELCLDVYNEYKDDYEWFLGLLENKHDFWREADFPYIASSYSKRVKFTYPNSRELIDDADTEAWKLSGNLGTGDQKKRVIKVNYYELWDYFCDLIDATETNELKFIIGDNYIIRTVGGSLTILNPDLYNVYDLIRMEIVTNVLQDTNSRLLNVGSKNIYLLCNPDFDKKSTLKDLFGYKFEFKYEDITDTIP